MSEEAVSPRAGGPDAASADRREERGAGPGPMASCTAGGPEARPPASSNADSDPTASSEGIDGVLVDRISDWLISSALGRAGVDSIFEGCCQRLHAAGVPVVRALTAFRTLHPLFATINLVWRLNQGVDRNPILHEQAFSTAEWLRSPLRHLTHHRLPFLRRRLTGPHAMVDFPVLDDLRDAGITDYLCYLTPFASEAEPGPEIRGIVSSWATDRPSGFSDEDLRVFGRVQRRYAVSCKVQIQDRITRNVLETYLGPDAGFRVLDGQIRRGDGERIHAVIWYSDMRDSTRLADRLEPHAFIELLNRYFECTAGAVIAGGGEVLRFVGDAVLAIFPIREGGDDARTATERALAAARDAEGRLARTNERLAEAGMEPIGFGLGLHVGDVMYGNIGVPERLEFSVIGPAANEVARIEDLTKALERRVLVSAAFSAAAGARCEPLGAHRLRGVGAPVEVFAPC